MTKLTPTRSPLQGNPPAPRRSRPHIPNPTPRTAHADNETNAQDQPPGLTCWWDSDSDDEELSFPLLRSTSTHNATVQATTKCTPQFKSHNYIGKTNTKQSHDDEHTNTTLPSSPSVDDVTISSNLIDPTARSDSRQHTDPIREASTPRTILVPTQVRRAGNPVVYPDIPSLEHIEAPTGLHDNYYIGDSLQLPKAGGITRLYFQNLNGVNISNPGNWDETCSHLRDMEVDMALIAEHKLDTNQPRVLKKLHDEARKILGLGSFTITATSTPTMSPIKYKPGGVLSLTIGSLKGRILTSGADPLGRWTYTTLRRNSGPPITVIATYQVVKVDPKQAGPTTYATQLYAEYLREGRHNPDKLRWHHARDLIAFVKQCQDKGEWIIIAGDMNEVLGVDPAGMTNLHNDCGLVDACLERHGLTDFSTYQRGNKVIDYILVDRNVMQCIHSVGYEPFNIHILSDHRGIFIDLATPQCFGSNILPLQPVQLRDLSTKRSHLIAPYFRTKQKHLDDHQWHHKITNLRDKMKQDTPDHALAEDLYERLINASVYAGSTLKRFPPAPYSPTIARLRNIHRLLKLAVTQFKTGRNMSEHLERTKAKIGNVGYHLPQTAALCQQALVKVTRQLKATIQDKLDSKNLRSQHQELLIEKYEATGNSRLAKKI